MDGAYLAAVFDQSGRCWISSNGAKPRVLQVEMTVFNRGLAEEIAECLHCSLRADSWAHSHPRYVLSVRSRDSQVKLCEQILKWSRNRRLVTAIFDCATQVYHKRGEEREVILREFERRFKAWFDSDE